jgi:MFS family permease
MIAHISINDRYTQYYDGKIADKAEILTRGANAAFAESGAAHDFDSITRTLDMIFAIEASGLEQISYSLDMCGDGTLAVTIHIDDAPFREYSALLHENLQLSLFRGCALMALGIAVFAIFTNAFKRKKPDDLLLNYIDERGESAAFSKGELARRLIMQSVSMLIFGAMSVIFVRLYSAADGTNVAALLAGGLFGAIAAAHLIRVVFGIVGYSLNRPISSYAAQTTQFFMFLLIFLSLYSYSVQNAYSTQIELSGQDELRYSSIFASLTLGSNPDAILDFGDDNELLIITRDENGGFGEHAHAADLFCSAWEMQSAVAGVRGGYKYGVTALVENVGGEFRTTALVAVRQLDSIQADELRGAAIEFILEMSATVLAFVFLFIEINRLLETINLPNRKHDRRLRYGKAVRNLMFFVTVSRYVPLYFFILIVRDIYEHSPIDLLPQQWAAVLPLVVTLLVMVLGNAAVSKIIRLRPRTMMISGCFVGLIGFVSLGWLNMTINLNLPLLLAILAVAYTGVSMVYSGIWDYTSDTADTGHPEFAGLKERTFASEHLGAMAGAVIGAIVYDKLGLFAAFAVSAAILLAVSVLIRALLPADGIRDKTADESQGISLGRFLFSKSVMLFVALILLPFVLGEYFIEQFTPLYAKSVELSPGAASWNSLLMTLSLAYLGTPIAGQLKKKLSNTAICVIANMISAVGLLLFAIMPGIVMMYVAAGLIGVSIGIGGNLISEWYDRLDESEQYKNSGYVYGLFGSLFGQLGAVLFTIAHTVSDEDAVGKYIMLIAGAVIFATILYAVISKAANKRRAD